MFKRFCPHFLALSLFALTLIYSTISFAASLTLDKIGALDTSGKKYNQWWYTGTNPTLSGKVEDSQKVKVTIDSKTFETNANSSGKWSLATSMAVGKHDVKITAGEESYSFVLNIGSALPDFLGGTTSTSQSTSSVPQTGSHQVYFLIIAMYLVILGIYFYYKNTAQSDFEKKIL